jgi:thioredoxin-like negative regulator of GroEL
VAQKTRAFEIADPAVLMTSASGSGDAMPRDLFLPVPDTMLSRPFDRAAATTESALRAFRDRVPEASRAPFEQAVGLLRKGEYPAAEKLFKSAINVEADSTAAIAYVAATFAASGQDLQASGAWQTALVDGSEIPEIYEWLVGALLRLRDLSQARGMLDEALAKWPGDVRFARPMAIVYAALGQGVEALRMLERHLDANGDDVDALMLAVEWVFQLRQSGASAHAPSEDARLARRYADAYIKAQGPQAALVRQWMQAIEGRRR